MTLALAVGVAAGVGGICRYLLDSVIQHRHARIFPWGTLTINVSGSFLLGLATGLGAHHGWPAGPTTVFGAGFVGGYTTWSTYLWESVALAETGALLEAGANIAGSLVLGLAAAGAGFAAALL